jgi:hypothetical protein
LAGLAVRPLPHYQQEAQTSSVLERLPPQQALAPPGYLASRSHHSHKPAPRARLLLGLEEWVLLVVDRDWELASLDNNQWLVETTQVWLFIIFGGKNGK